MPPGKEIYLVSVFPLGLWVCCKMAEGVKNAPLRWWGDKLKSTVVQKTSVGDAIVCFRHLCFWLYCMWVHLSLLSFEKTFVFEANMCVGSRHQQGLISAQMTDGKRQWEDNRGGELQHYGGNKKSHQIRPGPQTESQKELFHLKKTLEECETAIASQCWCWEWGRSWGREWDPFWCGSWGRSWVCSWGRSWSQSLGRSQGLHHFEWYQ